MPRRDIIPNFKDRFWRYVEITPYQCWEWTGSLSGYRCGHIYFQGRMMKAHRLSYMHFKGLIPDGLEIDHLCRNPLCVNPDHLEAVTHKENLLRGNTFVARAAKGVCQRGHEMTEENTLWTNKEKGHKRCKICRNLSQVKHHHSKHPGAKYWNKYKHLEGVDK